MRFFTPALFVAIATGASANLLAVRSLDARGTIESFCNVTNNADATVYSCNHEQTSSVDDCKDSKDGDHFVYTCPPVAKGEDFCDAEYRPEYNEFVASCTTETKLNDKCVKAKSGDRWEYSCPVDSLGH